MNRVATLLIATLLATAAHAQSPETWIAVADDGRDNFGVAAGMGTREAAEISALGECGGGPACRIRLTAIARCVSYAHSQNAVVSGYGAGTDRAVTEQTALRECNARAPSNSCTIRSTRCFE